MVRVRQPSISRALATMATRYTHSNQPRLSDQGRTEKAWLPSRSRRAMSRLQGLSGP